MVTVVTTLKWRRNFVTGYENKLVTDWCRPSRSRRRGPGHETADEMCYDSKARPIRERKMPENLTHIETLARAHTYAAIKTLAEIMTDPDAPARARSADAAILAQLNQRLSSLLKKV